MPAAMKSMKSMKAARSEYAHFSTAELDLLKKGHDAGKTPSELAEALGRSLGAVCCRLWTLGDAPRVGRPPALTDAQKDFLVKTTSSMTTAADAKYQVTLSMVLKVFFHTETG